MKMSHLFKLKKFQNFNDIQKRGQIYLINYFYKF